MVNFQLYDQSFNLIDLNDRVKIHNMMDRHWFVSRFYPPKQNSTTMKPGNHICKITWCFPGFS